MVRGRGGIASDFVNGKVDDDLVLKKRFEEGARISTQKPCDFT